MRHTRWKVPAWLLAIGIALAIAVHVVLILHLGARATTAGALGVTALVLVAKHLGPAVWLRRKVRGFKPAEAAREDEST